MATHARVRLGLLGLAALAVILGPAARSQDAEPTPTPKKQVILFDEIPTHAASDAPFLVPVKASSGLKVFLTVVSGPAAVDGRKVTLSGLPGLVVLRASQEGGKGWLAADDAERAFTVTPRPSAPLIVAPPRGRPARIGETVVLEVGVQGEPRPALQWRRDGVALPGATGPSLVLNPVGLSDAGSYDVLASNALGSAVSPQATVTVSKRLQSLMFPPVSPATQGQPIVLSASATSGLPVHFELVSGSGFVSGNVLTAQSGSISVMATQSGDSTYEAAFPVTQTISIGPGPQGQRLP